DGTARLRRPAPHRPRSRRSRGGRGPHRPRRPARSPGRAEMTSSSTSQRPDSRRAGSRQRGGLPIEGVTLSLGDGDAMVTALDDVHLDVAPGEFVAIVGPSGSGKSSLLAVAGALTTPDTGRVLLDSVDISKASAREKARHRRERIGFVFQSGNLIPA